VITCLELLTEGGAAINRSVFSRYIKDPFLYTRDKLNKIGELGGEALSKTGFVLKWYGDKLRHHPKTTLALTAGAYYGVPNMLNTWVVQPFNQWGHNAAGRFYGTLPQYNNYDYDKFEPRTIEPEFKEIPPDVFKIKTLEDN